MEVKWKTVKLHHDIWKRLSLLRIENDLKTISDVIAWLLEEK